MSSGESGFAIHALAVGPGTLALSSLPGNAGRYAADLDHLLAWGPACVISMTTQAEMLAVGAGTLGEDLRRKDIQWVHLPVTDFGAPDAQVQSAWPAASKAATRHLKAGRRVLVHCRGGCGRSGMAALRLMVETGEPADQALTRLRAVRPCAVETRAQLHWARLGKTP